MLIYLLERPSVQGKDTQKQMDKGSEYTRQMLARKFKEISNDEFE